MISLNPQKWLLYVIVVLGRAGEEEARRLIKICGRRPVVKEKKRFFWYGEVAFLTQSDG